MQLAVAAIKSGVRMMLEAGANVIGGCCGTDPGYIRKMAEFINK